MPNSMADVGALKLPNLSVTMHAVLLAVHLCPLQCMPLNCSACMFVLLHACLLQCMLVHGCADLRMHACSLQCMLNNCTARTFRQVLIQRCHSTMLPQHLLVLPELNSRQHFYAKRITRSLTLIAVSLCKQAVMPLIFTISAGHTLLSALGLHAVSIGSACCQHWVCMLSACHRHRQGWT